MHDESLLKTCNYNRLVLTGNKTNTVKIIPKCHKAQSQRIDLQNNKEPNTDTIKIDVY